jgi:uncharacterized protein
MQTPFYNRTHELSALERAWQHPQFGAQMALVYGRRRLGKTYLLQHFFRGGNLPHAYFLADQSTASVQRLSLAQVLLDALPDAGVTAEEIATSWNTLFRFISQSLRNRKNPENSTRFGLVLDEFSYLVQQTPELPSILQAWWDREGSTLPLFLILCGSHLSVMAEMGAHTAPLFGRFTAGVHLLPPLLYEDTQLFYESHPYTNFEKLLLYGILGGTPRYHALVNATLPVAEAMTDLLLRPGAPLESEVRFLLGSEQIRDPAPYNAVLGAIAKGVTQSNAIANATGLENANLSYYLSRLVELQWVRRAYPYDETSDRRALWQIADPFLLFWYRLVQPLQSALAFSDPLTIWQERIVPMLPDYLGRYVFEEVAHQWLARHAREEMGITLQNAGRWWSRTGDIEIDIIGAIEGDGMLFGECKLSTERRVGMEVYARLAGKVQSLPNQRWKENPHYALFTTGSDLEEGFSTELIQLAQNPETRLSLIAI